jgi:hypothetical protein
MTSPGHPQSPLKWSSGSHPTRLPHIFSPRGESISALINREVKNREVKNREVEKGPKRRASGSLQRTRKIQLANPDVGR